MKSKQNRYSRIIEEIFFRFHEENATEISFDRSDITSVAEDLTIDLPKNLGDIIYSFRYRTELPATIVEKAPPGLEWIIRPAGQGKYKFVATRIASIVPNMMLVETKIPDSTPGIIDKYALNDEQALLAKLRYNRLIDIFTGLSCYSLQGHLRTTVSGLGQVETDEVYLGLDKRGVHFIITVQAKGGSDKIGVVQIEQDIAVCESKFPNLICRPIAAQFMEDNFIALFEFEPTSQGIAVLSEKHYRLVAPDQLSPEELANYRKRSD